MSFGGHAQDMLNRFKYNRSIRPSQKPKFKENIRDTIYLQNNLERNQKKVFDHPLSEKIVQKTIVQAKKRAQKRNKKIVLTYLIYLLLVFIILVFWLHL